MGINHARRWAVAAAIILGITGFPVAMGQPVRGVLAAPFQESVQEEVKVSGSVIVGIAATDVLSGTALMSGFLVPYQSTKLCLTVRSRDGVYFSRNAFNISAVTPVPVSGILLSLEGTRQQKLLDKYSADDVAVSATDGDCSGDRGTWLVPNLQSQAIATVDVLVNGFGATAVFYATSLGQRGDCIEFQQGRRTSYDFRCRIERAHLPDGVAQIEIERERYGRKLPTVPMSIALLPKP